VSRALRGFALPLFLALAVGCGEAPAADGSVDVVSEGGSIEAKARFAGAVRHGQNTLLVELAAVDAQSDVPSLVAVEAVMPGHGHRAQSDQITHGESGAWASHLDLFMAGRWEIDLTLGLGGTTDALAFPVDVP
jgi:hypothetical protein